MTSTDKIADARIRDSVYVLRYARQTYKRHAKILDDAIADLIGKLNIRVPSSGQLSQARLEAMLDYIKINSSELYAALESAAMGDIKELATYESAATAATISAAYPIAMEVNRVAGQKIYAAAMSRPFQGKLLRDWYKDQSYAAQQQYKAAIRMGYVQGETVGQITGRFRRIGDLEKRHAETIVRTALNHTANTAMRETSIANEDILAGEEWVATLDGRTTPICQKLDGKVFKIGSGPQPPAHFGCRSVRIPKTKSWSELGFSGMDEDEELSSRPFVRDKRRVKDIPKEERAELIGKTTAKSYNEWLRTQPRDFVEEVLGKTKAKLYLDGGLTLDRFVDRYDRTLTLKEISEREWGKKAFQAAGIDG